MDEQQVRIIIPFEGGRATVVDVGLAYLCVGPEVVEAILLPLPDGQDPEQTIMAAKERIGVESIQCPGRTHLEVARAKEEGVGNARILCATDDEEALTTMQAWFQERESYQPTFSSNQEALVLLEKSRFRYLVVVGERTEEVNALLAWAQSNDLPKLYINPVAVSQISTTDLETWIKRALSGTLEPATPLAAAVSG